MVLPEIAYFAKNAFCIFGKMGKMKENTKRIIFTLLTGVPIFGSMGGVR